MSSQTRCILAVLFLHTCVVLQCVCQPDSLKVAAFNIQILGKSKIKKENVVRVLVDILSQFDIVLIQEIRDVSGNVIVDLLERVNSENGYNPFSMKLSPRMGRTNSKEQYAFFYRENSGLTAVSDYVYDDGDEDLGTDYFEREPYIVLFESRNTIPDRFALIGIHISPDTAVKELQMMEHVFQDVYDKFNTDNIMLMGDLNGDCSYVPKYAWKEIPIRQNRTYTWLIPDDADTTVSKTDCAYDRFVMTGDSFREGYIVGSAKVHRFDQMYGLSYEQAKDVSDHYPISFELKYKQRYHNHYDDEF